MLYSKKKSKWDELNEISKKIEAYKERKKHKEYIVEIPKEKALKLLSFKSRKSLFKVYQGDQSLLMFDKTCNNTRSLSSKERRKAGKEKVEKILNK